MIVALDSGDASGKTTQATRILEYFANRFKKTQLLHFPVYDSVTGRVIKEMLAGRITTNPVLLQSAMIANRFEFFSTLTEYANDQESLLILDRYSASAFAYGLADGLSRDFLERIHASLPKPKHYFYLDISVEESFRRRPNRQDAYEADRERLEQVRKNYLDIFNTSGPEYHVIDGMLPKDVVTQQIVNIIEGV